MLDYPMYLVGGAVRDYMLELKWGMRPRHSTTLSGDVDFAVAADSFENMQTFLKDRFEADILHTDSTKGVVRAYVAKDKLGLKPVSAQIIEAMALAPTRPGLYADFKVTSKPGVYTDNSVGRYPATIEEDLAGRDFTINAMGWDLETDELIDPSRMGKVDISLRLIEFNGNPGERVVEDYLRVIRAYRFLGTLLQTYEYGWKLSDKALDFIHDNRHIIAAGIKLHVHKDRIVSELKKLFRGSTTRLALDVVDSMPEVIRFTIFDKDKTIWLMPTTERAPSMSPRKYPPQE